MNHFPHSLSNDLLVCKDRLLADLCCMGKNKENSGGLYSVQTLLAELEFVNF
jgi:hypothetical protein